MQKFLKYVSYQVHRSVSVLGLLYVHARCYRPLCLAFVVCLWALIFFFFARSFYLFHWGEMATAVLAVLLLLLWYEPSDYDEQRHLKEAFQKLDLDTEHVLFNRLDNLVIHFFVNPVIKRALLAKRLNVNLPSGKPAPPPRPRL